MVKYMSVVFAHVSIFKCTWKSKKNKPKWFTNTLKNCVPKKVISNSGIEKNQTITNANIAAESYWKLKKSYAAATKHLCIKNVPIVPKTQANL